jgi:hypothetical protein
MKAMVIGLGRVGFSYSTESQRGFSTSHVGAYLFHPDIDTVIGVDTDKEKLEEAALWDREIKPQYISMDPINSKFRHEMAAGSELVVDWRRPFKLNVSHGFVTLTESLIASD